MYNKYLTLYNLETVLLMPFATPTLGQFIDCFVLPQLWVSLDIEIISNLKGNSALEIHSTQSKTEKVPVFFKEKKKSYLSFDFSNLKYQAVN